MSGTKTIAVDLLARVEGEGGLYVQVRDGRVEDVELRIFEPPRFFEALLRGRAFTEAPDITARICGICPVAYQMSAVHAMEAALGVAVPAPIRALRRLIYCGEWIESHVLHVTMLHAPDFLGFEGVVDMAARHRDVVERSLRLKKAGNAIVALVGGREIHPINVRVGGFYRAPTRRELSSLVDELRWARDAAVATVRWTAGFEFPDLHRDRVMMSLVHPDEYPMNEGRLVSTNGHDVEAADFERLVREIHVERSNALHAEIEGVGPYLVGPMARFNLCFDRLAPVARELAHEVATTPPVRNVFRSIVVRSLEVLHACEEALAIIEAYEPPERPAVPIEPRAGTGHAITEAPRGLLYHGYEIDEQGTITKAVIVPPTSQNQPTIEADLRSFVQAHLALPEAELTWKCEQAIRSYDPCISCATHFLKLEVDRG